MKKSIIIKIVSLFLILILFFSFIAPVTAFGTTNATIATENITADPGDTVNVKISLSNNPGIVSATIKINYDSSVLTLTNVTDAGVLGAQSHKPEYTSPYTLAWANDTATTNYIVNGTIATLTFKVGNNAVRGQSYPITLSYNYNNYEIYDKDLNPVQFNIINGSVSIRQEKTLSSISISNYPNKTTYNIGESLDTTGLQLKLSYSDGSTSFMSSGFTTTGFSSTSAGTISVTVGYNGKTTSFSVTVQDSIINYDGRCGDDAYYKIDRESKTLIISGTGYMWHYEHKEVPWVNYKTEINRIIIENGIRSIGTSAFGGFTNLTSVDLANSITDVNSSAFVSCTSLERFVIPEGVEYLGQYVFDNCKKLKSIQISSTVNSISEQAFGDLISLEEIIVSAQNINFYAENGVLYGKGKLYKYPAASTAERFIVPNEINTVCWRSFSYSKNLKTIELSTVTSIKSTAFEGCENLQAIDLTNCNIIEEYAFSGCIGLENVALPNSISSIEKYTFYGCSNLTEISIPNNVNKIGSVAFYGCDNLIDLILPESVTSIGDMAFRCSNLRNVTILSNNVDFGDSVFGYVSNGRFVGSKDLVLISYKDSATEQYAKENSIPFLDINSKELISISVSSLPKTTYFVGESLDTTGLQLKLNYDDGSTSYASSGFTTSGFSSASAGTKTVTITYQGKTTTFNVTVKSSNVAMIAAENATANPGDTIDVKISLNNNPGIVSATIKVLFDSNVLTLTKVTDAGVLGAQSHKPEYTSPYTLAWANDTATSNYTVNGTIATLTFKVGNNAVRGQSYPITLSYNYNNYEIYDKDLNPVQFAITNGSIGITTINNVYLLGDTNGDGYVSISDATTLQRYIAEFDLPNPEVIEKCGDVNNDGIISISDATEIQKYLAEFSIPYDIGKPI